MAYEAVIIKVGVYVFLAVGHEKTWVESKAASIRFPLGQSLDALIAGSWFPGEEHLDWGAGIGLRYRPGQ